MSDSNKREQRVLVTSPLSGEVKVFHPMTILDVSRGGAQIETSFPLQLDSLHEFRITLADRSIVVQGRIAHCQIGELKEGAVIYRSGIEFIEPPEHAQVALDEFVEAVTLAKRLPVVDGEIEDIA